MPSEIGMAGESGMDSEIVMEIEIVMESAVCWFMCNLGRINPRITTQNLMLYTGRQFRSDTFDTYVRLQLI